VWKRRRSTDKRYPGDNRLIFPKSPYRREGLAPRCRLVASWGCSRSQGLGCSPIKAVRELGLERRTLRPQGVIPGCSPAHIGETLIVTSEQYDQGNTEGRPAVEASQASYLAGFMDGDGSIHFQLVRQAEYRYGFYIRASLSLSQSTSARHGLEVIQAFVGGGYLRDRGTGMSDLVITSRPLLRSILMAVEPYVIFKREHVRRALILLARIGPRVGQEEFLRLAREVDAFATLNYSKTKRITAVDVERHLRSKGSCAPVTTSLLAQQGDGVEEEILSMP
jgi:LAGLIDADG endonuclease